MKQNELCYDFVVLDLRIPGVVYLSLVYTECINFYGSTAEIWRRRNFVVDSRVHTGITLHSSGETVL
jgi:hypothetical protein